jgi:hypothetical protein
MTRARSQPIPRDCRGSAMLAALCLAMVFAISLSSYLALCYENLYVSERNAMTTFRGSELAESGVEQALYCLNNNNWTGWTLSGSTASATMTMTSAGLSTAVGATPLSYGNGVTGTVTVSVTNYNSATNPASISSQATLSIPSPYGSGSAASIHSGTVTFSPSSSAGSSSAAPLFVNAVAATNGTLRFQSAGTVDSYNSVLPVSKLRSGSVCEIISVGTTNWTLIGSPSNTVGTIFTATAAGTGTGTAYVNYNSTLSGGVPINAGYSAVILSQDNYSSSATVRLKNATVNGYAVGYDYSSPSSTNWFSYGAAGKLVGPNTASGTSIDSSRILSEPSPYQPVIPDSVPSSTATLPMGGGTVSSNGSTINQTGTLGVTTATTPVVYSVGNGISLLTNQTVTIVGPVVLISYGGVAISGTAKIALTTPQASLTIFVEYGNLSLGGTGITNSNTIPLPKKVAIIDTTNTFSTATIGTAQPFYGVVYLPYMPITVSNTGVGAPIYGSIVGESVIFSGAAPILHYDSALRFPVSTVISTAAPLQYGAAFDHISSPTAYPSMVLTSQ